MDFLYKLLDFIWKSITQVQTNKCKNKLFDCETKLGKNTVCPVWHSEWVTFWNRKFCLRLEVCTVGCVLGLRNRAPYCVWCIGLEFEDYWWIHGLLIQTAWIYFKNYNPSSNKQTNEKTNVLTLKQIWGKIPVCPVWHSERVTFWEKKCCF